MTKRTAVLKTLLIGEGAVGKTSLIDQWIHGRFKSDYSLTVGLNVASKTITFDKLDAKLVINDIAGQKRFKQIRGEFFKGTSLIMMVYDCTRPKTLDALLTEWLPGVVESNPADKSRVKTPRMILVLVSNKSDLADERQVTTQKGRGTIRKLKNKYKDRINVIEYIETSAKKNINVNEAFTLMARGYLEELIQIE